MAPEVQPDFTGHVVKIYTNIADTEWRWWTMDEPRFELQHGRLFLVGRLTDSKLDGTFWGRNTTAYVPWESVQFYLTEALPDRMQRKFGGPNVNTLPM